MFKKYLVLMILFFPDTVLSAQFDLWETGMTLTDVVEIARQHNVPIRQSGVHSPNKNFDKSFLNERFWSAKEVVYVTNLLGMGAKVVLKIHPDWPRRVYEIEIRFAGKSSSQEFKSELLEMLAGKYGQPNKALLSLRKTYRWQPAEGDQIILTMYSFPVLSYVDANLKDHALKQMGYKAKNQKHGFVQQDSNKF
ncbi:hypothetical protein SAMN02745165_02834 [Malonomonas rubra DSM 5091]|uniref:Uncharacterized protein n=1 Tax=Malonomonas rubra DSM 5091 TaxID=1122189 RepID=A0A1M6KXK2_MALRU|nr:hypothetical protein [Malonomonas rubra]SHJ63665.1 hypothetical protein SAMN02745165_02834 [Malonomonas rubra DSM 5091]